MLQDLSLAFCLCEMQISVNEKIIEGDKSTGANLTQDIEYHPVVSQNFEVLEIVPVW